MENARKSLYQIQNISEKDPAAAELIGKNLADEFAAFKWMANQLSGKILERTTEFVDDPNLKIHELSQAANILKNVSDTLNLYPKNPQIAIQNNLQQISNVSSGSDAPKTDFKFQIEFVTPEDDEEIF